MRNHPLLSYCGQSTWPPVWLWVREGENTFPAGEVGVLTGVRTSIGNPNMPEGSSSNRVHLYMSYRGALYIGTLLFDDPDACRRIGDLLSQQCGKTIKELGDLDLSELL